TNDIKDHDTYESTTMGVGIGTNDNKPSLNSFEYTNNTKDKEQINRATVGKGILTTDSDTTNLNRDTSKTQQITKDVGWLILKIIKFTLLSNLVRNYRV
ncbi:hypothetical protein KJ870_07715, partial [bacterium]|nr:hypothetical protein [bacterium]MBU1434808.1 hypothetical protein [bacterium]MBU1503913.1 hypothetical protein [bacterium]MBU4024403.1 hypothetical protein [bacterium]MBU4111339.1 hypothetical protein [bacterium]